MVDFNRISKKQKNEPVPVADFLVCITSLDNDEPIFFEGADGEQVVPFFDRVAAAESFLATVKGGFDKSRVGAISTLGFVGNIVNPDSDQVFRYKFNPESLEDPISFTEVEILYFIIDSAYKQGVEGVERVNPFEGEPDPENN